MHTDNPDAPFIMLIDDDDHSAHLLTRMLAAHGAPAVMHVSGASAGEAALSSILADHQATWPGLLIVDLKSHSAANMEFVVRNHAMLRQKGVPLAIMAAPTDRAGRRALQDAGANAVFFRQAELDAYRHEVASIVSFWARNQCLDAIGM
ncbi:MAG: hypothetical protein ABS75_29875 [Pelagibacterium sp. SCN 63-23]|nr:MAG: hypothetical protein ABS75_29875 [Pelagibacterium sp. SCN 63-23]